MKKILILLIILLSFNNCNIKKNHIHENEILIKNDSVLIKSEIEPIHIDDLIIEEELLESDIITELPEESDINIELPEENELLESDYNNLLIIEDENNIIIEYPIIYEQSNYGNINYVLKDTMILNEINIINMTISDSVDIDIIIDNVETFTHNNIVTNTIRISPLMSANLIDPSGGLNFKIIPITPIEQIVENNQITKWEWNVIPLTKGEHEIKLIVDIIYDNYKKNIKVYEDFIIVYSDKTIFHTIFSFLKENWEWFLSTLIIPFLIFLYGKMKKN